MQLVKIIDLKKFIPNYTFEKEKCLDCFLDNVFLYEGIVVQGELTRNSNIKQISTTTYQKRDLSLLIQLKKERVYSLFSPTNKDNINDNESCKNCKYKHDEIILESEDKREIHHFVQRLKMETKYHFH